MKTDWTSKRNLSMLTDFYEFTMGNAFLETDMDGIIAYFDMFFRNVPDEGGFAIAAGLEDGETTHWLAFDPRTWTGTLVNYAALDAAIEYSKQRVQFKKPISANQ